MDTLPQQHTDTRPRADYRLPDGRIVRIIRDHGEAPASIVTYQDRAAFPNAPHGVVEATLVTTKVRVRYRRAVAAMPDGLPGWEYVVLHAESLTYLGGGWSAGGKRDAMDAFAMDAREKGWVLA